MLCQLALFNDVCVVGIFEAEVREKDAAKSSAVNVTLSAWDFAGQDVYYSTHQFFLSDRSLYVLVWNLARPETESRLGYWLKVVQARAGKSPIVLVATHLDDKVCTKEYVAEQLAEVERKYRSPALRFVRAVSCESGRGVEELRQEIENLVLTLDKMGELIPSSYLSLEKFVLEERPRRMPPVVSLRTFQAMAAACNVTAADSQAVATRLLHSLGVLVHYGQDPRLKDLVILDPQWLIEVMASILTTKHNFSRNGLLPLSALLQLWREPKFPVALHGQLVQLLEHFEVLFRKQIDEDGAVRELLLVPALLPEARPPEFKLRWRGTAHGGAPPAELAPYDINIIGRRFTLSFVPRGLMGRVLVRLLRWMEPACLWQSGMLLQYGRESVCLLLDNLSVDIYVHSVRSTLSSFTPWSRPPHPPPARAAVAGAAGLEPDGEGGVQHAHRSARELVQARLLRVAPLHALPPAPRGRRGDVPLQ